MRTKESRTQGLSSAGKSHSCPLPKLLSPTCLDRSYIIRFIIGAQTTQANMHVWKHNMMKSKWLSMQMHTKPRTCWTKTVLEEAWDALQLIDPWDLGGE